MKIAKFGGTSLANAFQIRKVCDIVLADPTLPDESMQIEASETGVTIGGEAFEQLHVKTVGATSFAVGPADAPWGALVWPKREEEVASRSDAEAQKPEAAASEKKQEESAPDYGQRADSRCQSNSLISLAQERRCCKQHTNVTQSSSTKKTSS